MWLCWPQILLALCENPLNIILIWNFVYEDDSNTKKSKCISLLYPLFLILWHYYYCNVKNNLRVAGIYVRNLCESLILNDTTNKILKRNPHSIFYFWNKESCYKLQIKFQTKFKLNSKTLFLFLFQFKSESWIFAQKCKFEREPQIFNAFFHPT